MAASKRFGRYKKEERKEEREADVRKDKALSELIKIWRSCVFDLDAMGSPDSGYSELISTFRNLRYSPEDVEKLSRTLPAFQDTEIYFSCKAGIFLSALVNSAKENDYFIHTSQFKIIEWLGYRNKKKITIIGDAGYNLGQDMERGSIRVEGNTQDVGPCIAGGDIIVCGNVLGSINNIEGGSIKVEGNVGLAGSYMKGGKIIVKGNAGEDVGHLMQGGEIHIEGKIGSIGNVIHGKIYHRGRLIVDK